MVRAGTLMLLLAVTQSLNAQQAIYANKLRVGKPTRIDWMYPLLKASPVDEPDGLLEGYNSKGQRYEFFGPVRADPVREYPLILYVSPSNSKLGWKHFQFACEQSGSLFAAPYDAGNGKPLARRVRITLDVLDDVRRRYRVDPERTYLAGFSGGAFVAYTIAIHLPEYFGGVMVIGHAPHPPTETWLLHRAQDRLSVAMLCGERESIGDAVVNLYGPLLDQLGIRSEYYAVPNLRHRMPSPAILNRAFRWLERDVTSREQVNSQFPAISFEVAPTREEWAAKLLSEAKGRVDDLELNYAGLVQLEWIRKRWPDLPEALEATKLLECLTEQENLAMRAAQVDEQREWQRAHAVAYENYARAKLDRKSETTRFLAANRSIRHWKDLLRIAEAHEHPMVRKRIAELEEIAAAAPLAADAKPQFGGRLSFRGRTTVRQLVEFLNQAFGEGGFEFVFEEEKIDAAHLDIDAEIDVNAENASIEELLRVALKSTEFSYVRRGNSFLIAPKEMGPSRDQ